MARRRLPFEYSKKTGYRCNLDSDEIHLMRRLLGEVRELLTTTNADDSKMQRLFPPAYDRDVDAEANADYRRLMHDELVASRLDSLATIDEIFSEEATQDSGSQSITEDQLHALAKSLNSVRLILGSLLGITDDEDVGSQAAAPENMALYHYLSWLLECAIGALTARLD